MNDEAWLSEFASRYAAAWCSQNPAAVAQFFAPDASLTINGGAPAVRRLAITGVAHEFMRNFPDLCVRWIALSCEVTESSFIGRSTPTIPVQVALDTMCASAGLRNRRLAKMV